MPLSSSGAIQVRRWAVWSTARPLLAFLLTVELAAVAAVATSMVAGPGRLFGLSADLTTWTTVAVLAAAGVLRTEASRGVERMRQRSPGRPHTDLGSAWTVAAALLVPPQLAVVVLVVVTGHGKLRAGSPRRRLPYRDLYSLCTVVLAVYVVATLRTLAGPVDLYRDVGGLLVVVLALVAYGVVNLLLVAVAIRLSGVPTRQAFGHRDEWVLEAATLAMGAVVAGVVAAYGPGYAMLLVPPLVVLHRSVLVRQLEEAASTDGKTGLLTAAEWRRRAERVLAEEGAAALLLLDLDHFKAVNDRHGHLAGDQVLSLVGATLRAEVRDRDLAGRFGGEEFVVLLTGSRGSGMRDVAAQVAERIRRRVAELSVPVGVEGGCALDGFTVSVGVAVAPADGAALDDLLAVADTALYAAKDAGRNAVRGAGAGPEPPTRP